MTMDVRPLTAEDSPASWALGSLSFGYQHQPRPETWDIAAPGRRGLGAFDPAGRLVAQAVDLEQAHWFGGRAVPASGVASVAVAAERRSAGLGRQILTHLLGAIRDRGAVVSTLFPTTSAPYRRLGWEEVGVRTKTAVPTSVFAGARAPAGLTTRAATVDDVPLIQALYEEVARAGNGPMQRSAAPRFRIDPPTYLDEWDGVTVVADDLGLRGYTTWDRGPGYDESGRVIVGDLIGRDADATAALFGVLAGWAGVAPMIVLRLGATDPIRLLTAASGQGRIDSCQPWMLRLVDAAGAIAARGWSPFVTGAVDLALVDPECPWNAGNVRLVLAGGEARLEPGGTGAVRFGPRGLAAWYANAASPAVLRRAGLLAGDPAADALLTAATAGPPPELLDYF